MATTSLVTNLDTYKQYLQTIGDYPSYQLEKAFACGLPAVWLYLKSIGLEDLYFFLLENVEKRPELFKELFYLLLFTNGDNKYFPYIPVDYLTLDIPKDVRDAQVQIQKPEFELAFVFDREQLQQTLQLVAKQNKMVRIGDRRKAIGIMYSNNVYHVYHTGNPRALEFNNIDGCVDLIMRVMQA